MSLASYQLLHSAILKGKISSALYHFSLLRLRLGLNLHFSKAMICLLSQDLLSYCFIEVLTQELSTVCNPLADGFINLLFSLFKLPYVAPCHECSSLRLHPYQEPLHKLDISMCAQLELTPYKRTHSCYKSCCLAQICL